MKTISLKQHFEDSLPLELQETLIKCAEIADDMKIKIYLIGGIVRDLILQEKIVDVDLLIEGNAVEFVKSLAAKTGCTILSVNDTLGTAKVTFGPKLEIDFASTRIEEYPKGGFLPIVKEIGCSLEEDAKRRDFSINCLAVSLNNENMFKLIDPLKGLEALDNKELSVLHEKSFIDDPSRIIRGLRFIVRHGFHLSKDTLALQNDYLSKELDLSIPLERIKSEIRQLFSLNLPEAYDEFIVSGAWKLICKKEPDSIKGSRIHAIADMCLKDVGNTWMLYCVSLVINEDSQSLERLNLTSEEIKIIKDAAGLIFRKDYLQIQNDNFDIFKFFESKHEISILVYYIFTNDDSSLKYLNQLSQIKLFINGNDLINLGFEPSPKFIEIFDEVLRRKLNGEIKTQEEEILVAQEFL